MRTHAIATTITAITAVVASLVAPTASALSSGGSTATRALNTVNASASATAGTAGAGAIQAAPVVEDTTPTITTHSIDTTRMAATDGITADSNDWSFLRTPGTFIPGGKITTGTTACTTGYIVNVAGTKKVLTAGHCGETGTQFGYRTQDGTNHLYATISSNRRLDNSGDWALLDIAPNANITTELPIAASKGPMMASSEAATADAICVLGQVSGLSCGDYQHTTATGRIVFEANSTHGDSGAPVFALKNNTIHPIGILEGGYPNTNNIAAMPLDHATADLGITHVYA